jgi:hypothetical protein
MSGGDEQLLRLVERLRRAVIAAELKRSGAPAPRAAAATPTPRGA